MTANQFASLWHNSAARALLALAMGLASLWLLVAGIGKLTILLETPPQSLILVEDQQVFAQLQTLPPAPLPAMTEALANLANFEAAWLNVTVEPRDENEAGPAAAKPAPPAAGSGAPAPPPKPKPIRINEFAVYKDKIGSYTDVQLVISGELYEQLLVLDELQRNFATYVVLKAVKGSRDKSTIQARIYGQH